MNLRVVAIFVAVAAFTYVAGITAYSAFDSGSPRIYEPTAVLAQAAEPEPTPEIEPAATETPPPPPLAPTARPQIIQPTQPPPATQAPLAPLPTATPLTSAQASLPTPVPTQPPAPPAPQAPPQQPTPILQPTAVIVPTQPLPATPTPIPACASGSLGGNWSGSIACGGNSFLITLNIGQQYIIDASLAQHHADSQAYLYQLAGLAPPYRHFGLLQLEFKVTAPNGSVATQRTQIDVFTINYAQASFTGSARGTYQIEITTWIPTIVDGVQVFGQPGVDASGTVTFQ